MFRSLSSIARNHTIFSSPSLHGQVATGALPVFDVVSSNAFPLLLLLLLLHAPPLSPPPQSRPLRPPQRSNSAPALAVPSLCLLGTFEVSLNPAPPASLAAPPPFNFRHTQSHALQFIIKPLVIHLRSSVCWLLNALRDYTHTH